MQATPCNTEQTTWQQLKVQVLLVATDIPSAGKADRMLGNWHLQHGSHEQAWHNVYGMWRLLLLLSAGMAACMECCEADLQSLKQDGEGQHAICLSK